MKALTVTALMAMILAFPLVLKKSRALLLEHRLTASPKDTNHLYDIEDFLS
jgi:hypothetical protein